ncbi:MAG TPA: hypothetical protein ENN87_12285 [Phycisphaerales bacterium]|nr:hypothetical protein [Phycisphaerales bacterium]
MVVWVTLESGGIWNQQNRRSEYLEAARGFLRKYAAAFPENRIARMYLGEPITAPKRYDAVPGAPDWAVWQRESLERLADIVEWWIDNRMRDNGEYGGGWGDDCEMWRWWVPVLIGFDSPKIAAAQERFSDALMSQSHMKSGYTTRMSDVEHTAEDSADVITPMMHLRPDDELWMRRAVRLAELMRDRWTGRNERGQLQFKSTYFTAHKVDDDAQRACDTVYHPRAVQPALLYWQRTGDPKLTELFGDWMSTWVDAAARAERGKPAGIIPSAIHWPDGQVGGLGKDWFDPRNHGEYTLYLWPSAMSMMTDTLLLTWRMTGDEKYLEPIRSMAAVLLETLENPPKTEPKPGSVAWCAQRMGGLANTLAKYRFLTGRDEFDRLLERTMSPYMRYRMRGDRGPMTETLRQTAEALRVNFEGYTSEVRYTDRVLRFPTLFGKGMLAEPAEPSYTPNTLLLYCMATGDPGDAGYFPLNAVRWLTGPREIAVLVTDSGPRTLEADLFHFGQAPREMTAELYLLEPGRYTWQIRISDQRDTPLSTGRFSVSGPRTRIAFEVPCRALCRLNIAAVREH